ncbi:ef hand family protein [Stylonychia lemnae]|uniref:Ef hand family protein n=1 Tax=Stylonychia lemnae TaxID=5949 RepID=A0A077ZZJ4_STYLE|nr:ef hand family protein [Stylonychia lemnae]|eukprot:CDW73943.1 ef hand family protein [Stylonychia lemnae]
MQDQRYSFDFQIELSRSVLTEVSDFDPLSITQTISSMSTCYVQSEDLLNYLQRKQIQCTDYDVQCLIRQYDTYKQGYLNREQFLNMILPNNNKRFEILQKTTPSKTRQSSSLSPTQNKRNQNKSEAGYCKLSYPVEYGLLRVIKKELDLVRHADELKNELSSLSPDIIELFYSVKGGRQSSSSVRHPDFFSKIDIQNFIKKYSTSQIVGIDDLAGSIMRRIDYDFDDKVKYAEFVELISPRSLESIGRLPTGLSFKNKYSPQRAQMQINFQQALKFSDAKRTQDQNDIQKRLSSSPVRERIQNQRNNESQNSQYEPLRADLTKRFSDLTNKQANQNPTLALSQSQNKSLGEQAYQQLRNSRGQADKQNYLSPKDARYNQAEIHQNDEKENQKQTEESSDDENQKKNKRLSQSNNRSSKFSKGLEEIVEDQEREEFYHVNQTPVHLLKNPPTKINRNSQEFSPTTFKSITTFEGKPQQYLLSSQNYHLKQQSLDSQASAYQNCLRIVNQATDQNESVETVFNLDNLLIGYNVFLKEYCILLRDRQHVRLKI